MSADSNESRDNEDEDETFEPPPASFHNYLAEMTNNDDSVSAALDDEDDEGGEEEELLVDDDVLQSPQQQQPDQQDEGEEDKDESYGHDSESPAQSSNTRGLMATPLPASYRSGGAALLLSPFSPTAEGRQRRHLLIESEPADDKGEWTLSKCRRVSILIKVGSCDASSSLCVFPLIHEQHQLSAQQSQQQGMSPTTRTLQLAHERDAKELVLVNPDAFGSLIPAEVTVETARLVAQVSHVASEDWARRYHFDHILWPHPPHTNTNPTLMALARAIVHDVSPENPSNSAVFVFGGSQNDRNQTLFQHQHGLLSLIVQQLLAIQRIITLSLLETVEEDLVDLMKPSNSPNLKLRHVDKRGAIVTNLQEPEITSLQQLHNFLKKIDNANGHTLATIKVHHPQSYETQDDDDDPYNIIQLVYCASADDFAPPSSSDAAATSKNDFDNRTKLQTAEKQKTRDRQAASVRKSLSGLRGVLRGLIVHDHSISATPHKKTQIVPPTISYRECTLTKLIQRCLDKQSSRAVVIGTVSPNRNSYHNTLQTLNYAMRLCSRPGDTAKSPFEARRQVAAQAKDDPNNQNTPRALFQSPSPADTSTNISTSDENAEEISRAVLAQLAHDERALLRSIVSDPRQRITRLVTPWLSLENEQQQSSSPRTPRQQQQQQQARDGSRRPGTTEDGKRLYGSVFEKLDNLQKDPSPPPKPSQPEMTEEEKERHDVTTSEQLEQLQALQKELAEIRRMKEQMGYPSAATEVPKLIEEEEDEGDEGGDEEEKQQEEVPVEEDALIEQDQDEQEEEFITIPSHLYEEQRAYILIITDGIEALYVLIRELRGRIEALRTSFDTDTNSDNHVPLSDDGQGQAMNDELDALQRKLHDANIAEAAAEEQLLQKTGTREEVEAAERLRETVEELAAQRLAVEDRVQLIERLIQKLEGNPDSPRILANLPEEYDLRRAAEEQFERLAGEVILLQSSVDRATLAREELFRSDGLAMARLREEEASHRRSLESALDRERLDAQEIDRLQQEGKELRERLLECEQARNQEASDRLAAEQIAEDAITEHENLSKRAEDVESRLHGVEEELAKATEELNKSKQESERAREELFCCLKESEELKSEMASMQFSHEEIMNNEQRRIKGIVDDKDSAMRQLDVEISQYRANACITEAQLASSTKEIEAMQREMSDIKVLHNDVVQKEKTRAEEIIASKDSTINQLESETSNYKETLSDYEKKFAQNEEEIHRLQREMSDMRIAHDKASWKHFEETQANENALKEKSGTISSLESSLQATTEKAIDNEKALIAANKEKDTLQAELAKIKSTHLEDEKNLHLLQTELEGTKIAKVEEIGSLQREIDVLSKQSRKSADSLDDANKLVDTMRAELDDLRSTKIQSNDEIDRLRRDIDSLRQEYENDNAKYLQVKTAYDLLQAESANLSASLRKASSDAVVKDDEIEKLKKEVDMSRKNHKHYTESADKARDALRAELAELKTFKSRSDDEIERLGAEIDRQEEARSKDQRVIDDMKKINNLLQSQLELATKNSNAKGEEVERSLNASILDAKVKDQEIANLRRELGEREDELQKSESLTASVTEMNKSLKSELKRNEHERLNSLWENHEGAIKRLKEGRILEKEQAELAKQQNEMLELKRELEAVTLDKKKTENDNSKLKSVVQQCHLSMEQMQKEFLELKALSSDATARLSERNNDAETLVNKKLEKEMSKMNAMKDEIEKQLVGANITINSLRQELQIAESRLSKIPPDSELNGDSSYGNTGATDVVSQLRIERDLRRKAEEIAAAVAARAKSGFAERDEEIVQLRMKVSSLTNGKEMGVRNSLTSGLDYLENVHDRSMSDIKRERDEARHEAREYKNLAEDLHRVLYERDHPTPTKSNTPSATSRGMLSDRPSGTDGH